MSAMQFCDYALQVCAALVFVLIAGIINDIVTAAFYPQPVAIPVNSSFDVSLEFEQSILEIIDQVEEVKLEIGYPEDQEPVVDPVEPVCQECKLADLTIKQLRPLCRGRIKGYSRLSKQEIVSKLESMGVTV